jgi:hypothetical protein
MKITKRRIINVEQFTRLYAQNERIYIVANLKDIDPGIIKSVGFPEDLKVGTTILPKAKGPVSEYNANGKFISHKDLPKETVYHLVLHRDWHGNYGLVDMPYGRYPRTSIPAPYVEFTIIDINKELFVATKGIDNNNQNSWLLKHCINLFLELFGICELYDKGLTPIVKNVPLKRVNWQILPEGEYPWQHLTKLAGGIGNVRNNKGKLERYRIESILSYKPDEVYHGTGGFYGYLVFIFKKKKLVIMENIKYGNATYVFVGDWKKFSQMTKAEIIQENLMKERLLHQKGWKYQLGKVME